MGTSNFLPTVAIVFGIIMFIPIIMSVTKEEQTVNTYGNAIVQKSPLANLSLFIHNNSTFIIAFVITAMIIAIPSIVLVRPMGKEYEEGAELETESKWQRNK